MPAPRSTRVADLMSHPVVTLSPDDDLATAATIIALKHIRHLPVVTQGRLVGMITHRDVLAARPSSTLHLSARETVALQHHVPARSVMQTELRTIGPGATAHDAAVIMLEARVGCLPVIEDDVLVGIICEADLVRFLVDLLEHANFA